MTNDFNSIWLCPSCASFNFDREHVLTCISCGAHTRKLNYKIIVDYSKDVFKYGHSYRNIYEKQVTNNGNVGTKFCLGEPDTIYTFIGIAALSGIIGNIAYDVVKSVSRIIINNFEEATGRKIEISDEEIEHIYSNFNDFINNFDKIDKQVASAITEEILAHSFKIKDGAKIAKLAFECENTTNRQEQVMKIIKKAIKREKNKPKPSPEDFDNFYGNIRIE